MAVNELLVVRDVLLSNLSEATELVEGSAIYLKNTRDVEECIKLMCKNIGEMMQIPTKTEDEARETTKTMIEELLARLPNIGCMVKSREALHDIANLVKKCTTDKDIFDLFCSIKNVNITSNGECDKAALLALVKLCTQGYTTPEHVMSPLADLLMKTRVVDASTEACYNEVARILEMDAQLKDPANGEIFGQVCVEIHRLYDKLDVSPLDFFSSVVLLVKGRINNQSISNNDASLLLLRQTSDVFCDMWTQVQHQGSLYEELDNMLKSNEKMDRGDLTFALRTLDWSWCSNISCKTVEEYITTIFCIYYNILARSQSIFLTVFATSQLLMFTIALNAQFFCGTQISQNSFFATLVSWGLKNYLANIAQFTIDAKTASDIIALFKESIMGQTFSMVKFGTVYMNKQESIPHRYFDNLREIVGQDKVPSEHSCAFYIAKAISGAAQVDPVQLALALELNREPQSVDCSHIHKFAKLLGVIPMSSLQEMFNNIHALIKQCPQYSTVTRSMQV